MKKLLLILMISLRFIDFPSGKKPIDRIEFIHFGTTTKINRVLYLCKAKPHIKLTKQQITDLQRIIGDSVKITAKKKAAFIVTKYNVVITNRETLDELGNFITSHSEYYANEHQSNHIPGVAGYNIVVNGKQTFSIFYKSTERFQKELIAYLKQKNCDKNVLTEISYL